MKKTWIIVLIILALSVATRFAFFGHPNSTVFDEVHFGKFISGYLNHKYFFDIHPPLGKLAIAGVAKLTGYKTGFDFKEIAEKYPDKSYIWLRLLPVLAGSLLALVIFFLAKNLKFSTIASLAAALFIIFENAILGQSLFILLDSMLLLFGFLGLLLYLISRNKKSILIFILAIFCLSFSLSIKWTGLSFLALAIFLEIVNLIKLRTKPTQNLNSETLKRSFNIFGIDFPILKIILLILIPTIIYFSIFLLHFSILNRSGEGDAFHSKEFQSTIMGNSNQNDPGIKKANIFEKFLELNMEMYSSNGRISDQHPYASKWYTWPMMAKPIYYWNEMQGSSEAKIYLFGNPVIFWGSFLGVVILILDCIFFFRDMKRKYKTIIFILAGYFINYLPFILITRPMFLYHYLTALVFAILALCFVIDLMQNRRNKILIFVVVLAVAVASFFFFSPLTYGLTLSPKSFQMRLWTNNWQ